MDSRKAEDGDLMIHLPPHGLPQVVGVFYDVAPTAVVCDGVLVAPEPPPFDLTYCLHADDVRAALGGGVT